MKSLATLLTTAFLTHPMIAEPLTYRGEAGPGKGKHLVFLASDHEYRGEETCPALARILAKHMGFKCTVLFGVDDEGHLKAGASNVPGMDVLADADLLVIFARFLNLPAEQMDPLVAYLERGGPIVGLRTSSHAFQIPKDSPYARFDFKSESPEYEKGFGHQVLGNTWVGHYGKNHVQGTRITIIPEQKDHIILTGVGDNAYCQAGAYVGIAGPDFTVLTNSQPMVSMDKDAKVDESKPAVPSTWTRHYTTTDGEKHRVFHSTQGASEDILDPDYRRLLINGILWAVGMEKTISAELPIGFVGPYHPSKFSF
ncbi:MAG: ThuA domain-containing protein, partial [Verrucomicrobiota bacterium]